MDVKRTYNCVVWDIDGTVANIEHRRHYVQSKPKNWPAFEKGIKNDTRYDDMWGLYRIFQQVGMSMVFASGRNENQREGTEKWLAANGFTDYHKLYMRQANDYRRDDIVKREILAEMRDDGYDPWLVFDDRDQVVNMWREEGIRCLQVAPGNF